MRRASAVLFLLALAALYAGDEDWAAKESHALFLKAVRHQEAGKLEQAVPVYSEILEFFPASADWLEAGIRLSSIFLLGQQPDSSEDVLARLSMRAKGTEERRKLLLAHWDFFVQQKKADLLLQWLRRRAPEDLAALRDGPEILPRALALGERSPLGQLMAVLAALGYADIPSVLLSRLEAEAALRPELAEGVLRACLRDGRAPVLERCLKLLAGRGFHRLAHAVLSETAAAEAVPGMARSWLDLLVRGRMWPEADALLARAPALADRRRERLQVFCGLGRWAEAWALLEEDATLLRSGLSWDDIRVLVLGLAGAQDGATRAAWVLELVPESGEKLFLQIQLLDPQDKAGQEKLLRRIKAGYPALGDQAYLEIARLRFRQRKADQARLYLDALLEEYPASPLRKEAEDLIDMQDIIGEPDR